MRRFFTWSWDYSFGTFQTEEEAQADLKRSIDVVIRSGPENVNELEGWCWGEIRGTVHEDGRIVPMPPTPDTEAERLRAELADLHTRVGAALATLREMEAHHRQAVSSPAHGAYSFERAEAYDHAADLLTGAIETLADERAGGEE